MVAEIPETLKNMWDIMICNNWIPKKLCSFGRSLKHENKPPLPRDGSGPTKSSAPVRAVHGPEAPHDVRHVRQRHVRQNDARFRLYRHRFLQVNTRFSGFFKIYQILKLKFLKFDKILQNLRTFASFLLTFHENC